MTSRSTYPAIHSQKSVNDIIISFLASLKNFGLYAENHSICRKSILNAFNHLDRFLENAQILRLDIEEDRLLHQNETVYRDSESTGLIAYYLFRDGIKWISFSSGVTIDELKGFLLMLNQYRTIQEDPEGDLTTALWEANFPNISYHASDIYWESEPSIDPQLPVSGETPPDLESSPEQIQKNSLIQEYLNPEGDMYQLTPSETVQLQEMISEEEKRDGVQDFLELISILLKEKDNRNLLEALFRFIKNGIKEALVRGKFESACKILRTIHTIRSAAKTEAPWSIPLFNQLIISLSGPEYLNALASVLRKIEKTDDELFKTIGQFVRMLHTNAIKSLAPMVDQIRSISVQKKFIKILEAMASRNLDLLEQLLTNPDEISVQWLVFLTGRLPGERPEKMVRQMINHASARVRKQAIKCLLVRSQASLEPLFSKIEDSSEDVRQLIFGHLGRERNRSGERLLLQYLQRDEFAVNSRKHILNCYSALGKCGSASSLPFLEQVLFKNSWRNVFNGSVHRQGAVAALLALEVQEARRILSKASRSFSPSVRLAYKRGKAAIPC